MAFNQRTALPGSDKKPIPSAQQVGSIPPDEQIRVTVFLRRRSADPAPASDPGRTYMTREQFGQQHGSNPEDTALVERFAHEYQLTVVDSNVGKRRVVLTGSA